MKTILAVLSLVLLLAPASRMCAADKPEDVAQAAAEQWLALIDASNFAGSWETAAPLFQKAVSQADWEKALKSVRVPLGALGSRKLKSAKYTKTVPEAPDGEYVILQFETDFAEKKGAVETVTPMLDADGKWKVAGYYIK